MATVTWFEGTIPACGITIHYYQSTVSSEPGNSTALAVLPMLIFLHGLLSNSGTLQPVAAFLATDFQVILPDARGHAGSKPTPAGSFTVDNMVKDVNSLIQHVSPEKPVFLMGHGMGASVAARVAKDYPHLVRALILENPPWAASPYEKPALPAGEPLALGRDSQRGGAFFWPYSMANQGACSVLTQETSSKLLQAVTLLQSKTEDEFMIMAQSGQFSPLEMGTMEAQLGFDLEACKETFAQVMAEDCEIVAGISVPARLQVAGRRNGFPSTQLTLELADRVVQTWLRGSLSYFENGGHTLHIPPTEEDWIADVLSYFNRFSFDESVQESDHLR